jgi:membrane protease YdiL (CAAX protease family)
MSEPKTSVLRKWGVFGRVLLFLLACPVILVLTNPIASKLTGPWSEVAIGLGTTIATLLLTLLFVRWEGLRLSDVGAELLLASWGRLLLGFMIGLAMVAVQTALVCIGGHVRWVRTPGEIGLPIAISFFLYLLLASREELAFRGYPLRRLASTVGVWIAQFTVIVAFVLEHRLGGFSWTTALLGVSAGALLFGVAAIATRGLAVPIGLHAAFNFGQWVIGEKERARLWRPVIEESFREREDVIGMLSYLFVFGLVTLAFWWWQHKNENLNAKNEQRRPACRESTNSTNSVVVDDSA